MNDTLRTHDLFKNEIGTKGAVAVAEAFGKEGKYPKARRKR